MAEYQKKLIKLSKGQISTSLLERTDTGLLDDSGQVVNNFFNSKYGLFGTVPGTKHCLNIGVATDINKAQANHKLFKLNLPNGDDVLLIVKVEHNSLTQKDVNTLYVVDSNGKKLYEYVPEEILFTSDNLTGSRIIQNNDSIIVITKGNPLYTFKLTLAGAITDYGIFNISNEKVIKVSTIEHKAINPVLYRTVSDVVPDDPFSLGMGEGDYIELSATGTPSITTETYLNCLQIDKGDGHTYWLNKLYTPTAGDYCKNTDGVYYLYNGTLWGKVNDYQDTHYGNSYTVSAVSGYINFNVSGGIVLTKPDYYTGTPEEFARRLCIGCELDGEDGVGEMHIDDITGVTEGNGYRINVIKGRTYLEFLKQDTTYTGFTLRLSARPAFDTARVGDKDNIFGTANYPLNAFFFQQRLFIAGTELDTTQLIGSQVGKYNDFSNDYSGASTEAFQLEIAGTEKETIKAVVINQGLQIFTDKGEWLVTDASITTKTGFVRNSTIGSLGVEPIISANGATLFTPKQGSGLVAFQYNYETASYSTPTISIYTNVFNTRTHTMHLKWSYSANDDSLLYIVLDTGVLIIGNYLRDQEIQSFVTSDSYKYIDCIQCGESMFQLVMLDNDKVVLLCEDKNATGSCEVNPYRNSQGWIYGLTNDNFPFKEGDSVVLYDRYGKAYMTTVPATGTIKVNELFGDGIVIMKVGFVINSTFTSNPINHSALTFGAYKTLRKVQLVLTKGSRPDYITINGKHGVVKEVSDATMVTFTHLTRPMRECTYTIRNKVYPINIMSITYEYSI